MTDERLLELFESFSDGTLNESEAQELLGSFQKDISLKERFASELEMSKTLHGVGILPNEHRISQEVLGTLRCHMDSSDVSGAVISELRSIEKGKTIPFPAIIMGLAVAAALTLAFVFKFPNGTTAKDSIAVIASALDAKGSDQSTTKGTLVGKGFFVLESGIVRLDFPKGVRVTLEGPAELEVIGDGETRLHSGNLTAHVPPEGIGFLVHTEKAKVIDYGTTFGVSIGKDGSTGVEVYEGEVGVTPINENEEKLLTEGNSVLITGGPEKIQTEKLEPRPFRGWSILFGVLNTGGNVKFVNAQPIRNPVEIIDSENIIVFPERFNFQPAEDFPVTLTEPGDYPHKQLKPGQNILSAEGKRFSTYLLQYNPPLNAAVPNSDQLHFQGEVTFDSPILAVITNREQLNATDSILGKKRFRYAQNLSRGLESGDALTLSADRKTLQLSWQVMQTLRNGMDQVRVVVEAGTATKD